VRSQADVDWSASNNDEAVEVVIVAADRLLGAAVARNTNTRQRTAVRANQNVGVEVQTKRSEETSRSSIAGFLDGVAAMLVAG